MRNTYLPGQVQEQTVIKTIYTVQNSNLPPLVTQTRETVLVTGTPQTNPAPNQENPLNQQNTGSAGNTEKQEMEQLLSD